jgi:hypothetical protein
MNKNMNTRLPLTGLTALAMAATLAAGGARADERTDLETLKQTTINLIQILVQQGVLTQAKADDLVKQAALKAEDTVAAQKWAGPNVVRVQYVPEAVKKQIADELREEVLAQAKTERWGDANAVPEWVDRLKWTGDIRVGYQSDKFSSNNAPESYFQTQGNTNVTNTLEDRRRLRMRARLGLDATITPEISAGFRLTTGSTTDPTSTTQSLGQYDNKYTFTLDRAFLKFHSDTRLPWLTASAGRIPNPFFGTNLVWNDNLNFEGAAATLEPFAGEGSKVWRPYATVGMFALQDVESSLSNAARSKWLMGTQAGAEWVRDNNLRGKFGVGYYNYSNVSGIRNSLANPNQYDSTAPQFRQKGNTLFNIAADPSTTTLWALASDYRLLNLTGSLDLNVFNPVHVMATADYVKNVGFDAAKILTRTGMTVKPETTGYMARLAVGMPSMLLRDDWQLSVAYRYLEKDAVLDAFADSDFHLGGTNNRGYILGADYGMGKNTWLSARYMSSNEISGLPLSINVFQLYFNAKF